MTWHAHTTVPPRPADGRVPQPVRPRVRVQLRGAPLLRPHRARDARTAAGARRGRRGDEDGQLKLSGPWRRRRVTSDDGSSSDGQVRQLGAIQSAIIYNLR